MRTDFSPWRLSGTARAGEGKNDTWPNTGTDDLSPSGVAPRVYRSFSPGRGFIALVKHTLSENYICASLMRIRQCC